jgi:hypothetical protein
MTKRLEELFNLDSAVKAEDINPAPLPLEPDDEQAGEVFQAADKIDKALPQVRGMEADDADFDDYARKAMETYDRLVDLGMNVDDRNAGAIFDVASKMMSAAITAKTAKLDKKLKMIDLQLKKANLDLKVKQLEKPADGADARLGTGEVVETEGVIVTDRNSLLKEIIKQVSNKDK